MSTAEKIEAVRMAWYSGTSAREIAAHFNGATRNAVIGLYGRYPDLLTETPLKKPTKSVIAMVKAKANGNYTVRTPSKTRPKQPTIEPETFVPPEPRGLEWHVCGKPLMLLGPHQCKWPINEAAVGEAHLFCSAPAEKSYCEAHHARSFTTARRSVELPDRVRRWR